VINVVRYRHVGVVSRSSSTRERADESLRRNAGARERWPVVSQ
jgi:hypothetical protein